ncbi:MAG: serine/threonine-protein kinase [Phormidesmis sp.]
MATFPFQSIVAERLGDRYEILQPIGQPFGYQQFLANDIQQGRAVVIKSLTIEKDTPTGDLCCFEREIHLLESLSHPTIPRYIDSFTINTTEQGRGGKGLVLVQAHQGGHTLAQQVEAGKRFSEAEIKAIAKQLLQGLAYLHGKGLVHRDIKPSNIAIAERDTGLGQACWLNFGTVQYIQAQRNDALVGTYGYMPPEQVGGQATFASDLYSLGATLIYLATGRHLGELSRHPRNGGQKAKFACSTVVLSARFQQWLNWLIEPYRGDRPRSAQQALMTLNHLPLSMLKRQLRPSKLQMMPIPIKNNRQETHQPFFTQIRSSKKMRSLELVVPPVGLRFSQIKRALPPMAMGSTLLGVALHLLSKLSFRADTLTSFSGLSSLAAASLAIMGCVYSFRFFRSGFYLLGTYLLRTVHIQLEADVLLIAYKYWLRSPTYIVNTRRADIYNISSQPDDSTLRILTHHNRTKQPRDCYSLSVQDGALSQRDIRWLVSLLNDWRRQPSSCT